jgi:hypothetical protein
MLCRLELYIYLPPMANKSCLHAGANPTQGAAIRIHNWNIVRSGGTIFQLTGAMAALRSYAGHTVTGMSGVRGTTQLTLHLQSPAGAAAAQQAADAVAATAPAISSWQEHRVSSSGALQLQLWHMFLAYALLNVYLKSH